MKKQSTGRAPLAKKIKRLFTPGRGKYMHGLNPEEYFKQYWLSRSSSNSVKIIARLKGVNKKATLEHFVEEGVKSVMRELVNKDLEARDTPEGRAEQAERIRFNLELRRICKQMGWDYKNIKKLLK